VPSWLVPVTGLVVGLSIVMAGIYLLRPRWKAQNTRTDMGIALVTASVISVAIFVLQILDESRLRREEVQRQNEAANQALRIQLALSEGPLKFMNLRGQDLREVNLVAKTLDDAIFDGADLREANLRDARLRGARFVDARLDRANLLGAHLTPSADGKAVLEGASFEEAKMWETKLMGASLRNARLVRAELYGADLRCADAQGAEFTGAVVGGWKIAGLQYDEETVWPSGETRACRDPPCVYKRCELG
jgi:uncharacterized protein YjbI with pentapeptide repeats